MTAEIALLNRSAIALAADSAVTIGNKVYNSSNKLFMLSKYHPIGIMIYSKADFMDYPWEVLIKLFRKKLSNLKFSTLEEYTTYFLSSLESNEIFTDEVQRKFFEKTIFNYYYKIVGRINNTVKAAFEQDKTIKESEVVRVIDYILKSEKDKLDSAKIFIGYSDEDISNISLNYKDNMLRLISIVLQKLPLDDDHKHLLVDIASNLIYKLPQLIGHTGVVIAGFGDEEIFPSLFAFEIFGIFNNKLLYRKSNHANIGLDNRATIVPFAQSEMVASFMEGCDPDYDKTIHTFLEKIFTDLPSIISNAIYKKGSIKKDALKTQLEGEFNKIFNNFNKNIDDFQYKTYIEPIIDGVASLPLDELASMAESLVNLTSFKRRVSLNQSDTVGGPIDVAVISKGDGFIWVKRKHYFKQDLNNHFFENYYKED